MINAKRTAASLLVSIVIASVAANLFAQGESKGSGAFNPKDLDNLEMFLESVKGLAIATNTSRQAYESTGENTVLEEVWSDKRRFPHGTVRWWLDQVTLQKRQEDQTKPHV